MHEAPKHAGRSSKPYSRARDRLSSTYARTRGVWSAARHGFFTRTDVLGSRERPRNLKAKIAAGQYVVELDPKLVNASFVSNRIPVEHDSEFDTFVKSIEEQGQQVPILVRPDTQAEDDSKLLMGTAG